MADTSSGKLSKNQRRRQKKKLQKSVENGAQSNHTSHSAEVSLKPVIMSYLRDRMSCVRGLCLGLWCFLCVSRGVCVYFSH